MVADRIVCSMADDRTIEVRIAGERARLPPAERRVAEVVLEQPELVAFGTVARVANKAGTSGASVLRLATRLGYRGFSELQAAVQRAIGQQLRPAVERIRGAPAHPGLGIVARTLQADLDNVDQTLGAVTPEAYQRAVELLSQRQRPVRVLAGDAVAGVAAQLVAGLALLRPEVAAIAGSDVAVARQLAAVLGEPPAVLVTMDLRRYERWVVEHARRAARAGTVVVAITDSVLSPLAGLAEVTFTVRAEGAGPFDSLVGMLALTNALVSGVAGRLRRSATPRLAAVEAAWRASDALLDP
jgi:DNA-binding MurR/RpiR family transcriptional regulator